MVIDLYAGSRRTPAGLLPYLRPACSVPASGIHSPAVLSYIAMKRARMASSVVTSLGLIKQYVDYPFI